MVKFLTVCGAIELASLTVLVVIGTVFVVKMVIEEMNE